MEIIRLRSGQEVASDICEQTWNKGHALWADLTKEEADTIADALDLLKEASNADPEMLATQFRTLAKELP